MTKFGKRAVGDINFLGEIDIFLGDGENIDFLGDIIVLVVQKLGNFCNFLGDSWKKGVYKNTGCVKDVSEII